MALAVDIARRSGQKQFVAQYREHAVGVVDDREGKVSVIAEMIRRDRGYSISDGQTAAAYVLTATPKYTAAASLLIDPQKNNLMQNQQVVGDQVLDASLVESQAEILRSDEVILAMVRKLKLAEDPEFANPRQSLFSSISGYIRSFMPSGAPLTPEFVEQRIVEAVQRNVLTVRRVGLTYVIEVQATTESAAKSAQIANAIVEAYLATELEAKYDTVRQASRWLETQITQLRDQATKADQAVQEYKVVNNIVDTSRGLMSEQQLSDVNTQLITARAATSEAKARLDRIDEVARQDIPDASVTDVLRNDVISRLRAQYFDIAGKEANWSARYGADHTAAANLRDQMRELKKSISDQVRQIAETYRSEYEIARSRESSLQQSLAKLVGESGVMNRAQVQLRDLESSAQTYRTLYDALLQKYTQASQQQTFPTSDARVIAKATTPPEKSSPKGSVALAGGIVVGFLLGCGIVLGRELLDHTMRTAADVTNRLGLKCLGILPHIKASPKDRVAYVEKAPLSRFAETLRSVKVSIDLARLTREVKIIGVVSSLPKEGKTTVAANLAFLAAAANHRVLLIDADLRNPAMSQIVTPNAKAGLAELLLGGASMPEVVSRIVGKLDFIPAGASPRKNSRKNAMRSSEVLASDRMAHFLEGVRGSYDYIFIELAPILAVVDVKSVGHLIDGFVYVVKWARTPSEIVVNALSSADLVRERAIGVVLNDADLRKLDAQDAKVRRLVRSYYTGE
jgi:succinoglycan biosynthesis transport protein ExoP